MIEVLVTIFILAIGLLGLAGLQSRMQVAESESYQRAQALIVLNDMASRMMANQAAAADYVTTAGTPTGTGVTCPATSPGSTRQEKDVSEWCNALQGSGEKSGTSNVGAMVGARGCVEDLGGGEYLVTVAWQGMVPLSAPPDAVACGADQYDGAAGCEDDLCRRVVTTLVRVPVL
jgi:type IV pilus assembly protein PilV